MEALARTGLTAVLGKAGLTATGAETVYDTANAFDFAIDGVLYSKAAVTDGATPTTDANTGENLVALADDEGCMLLWLINAAGTVALAQGPIRALDADTGDFVVDPQLPAVPDGYVPFAYQIIKNDSGSSFSIGSTNWSAVKDAIKDIATLPSRPPTDATA